MRLSNWDLDDATLRAAGTIKWTLPAPDVIPAWVAEMDVAPCPVVVDAVRDALARGTLGYPALDSTNGIPEATASFCAQRLGLSVDPAHVMSTGDVMAGVRLALEVLCDPAPVLVPVPSYPPFLDVVPLTGRRLVPVPTAGLELDLDAIDAALAEGARTVLLSQPYNPLGRVFSVEELSALRDVVTRHGARVISDEIHAPLVLPGARHVPYASIEGTADHVVTVLAATKAWNFPGLKCAQIITSNSADRDALHSIVHVANHGTSTLGIAGTVAAYTSGGLWLDDVLAHLSARREQFALLLKQYLPTLEWQPMQGTYLAWLDLSATGLADPAATALAKGRVMVNAGRTFGAGYDACARVNLATSAQRLERIVAGLAHAWAP